LFFTDRTRCRTSWRRGLVQLFEFRIIFDVYQAVTIIVEPVATLHGSREDLRIVVVAVGALWTRGSILS
jgi:hypothetical protein